MMTEKVLRINEDIFGKAVVGGDMSFADKRYIYTGKVSSVSVDSKISNGRFIDTYSLKLAPGYRTIRLSRMLSRKSASSCIKVLMGNNPIHNI